MSGPPYQEWWELAAPVQAGLARAAVTLTFGCGHVVHAVNGDALYHTCPFCFIATLAEHEARP